MFTVVHPDQHLAWCENNPKLSDLFPIMVGHEVCKKDKAPCCMRNLYYIIHYVKKGSGYITNSDGKHFITEGYCFIIRPDETLVYAPDPEDPWEYIWIGFSGALAKRFDYLPSFFPFPHPLFPEALEIAKAPALQEMLLTSLLYKLYVLLFGKKDTPSSDIKSTHVKSVLRYIDYNFMHDISIDEIAHRHNLNRNYLSQIFKEQVGSTMQEYRLKKRLSEAYEILSSGNSVSETAIMVGYNDISVFSRAFKKFHGISPGSVKKKKK